MRGYFANTVGRTLGSGLALFIGVLLVCFYGIWMLSADARRELDKLATAQGESMQWSLAQAEVEYLALLNAAVIARNEDAASLRELRLRFDIFYSRVELLKSATSFAVVRNDAAVSGSFERLSGFLAEHVAAIDGTDEKLGQALPDLVADVTSLRSDVRAIALSGVRIFAALSETQRQSVSDALFDLALLILMLVGVLLGLVLMLARLLAVTRTQKSEIEETRSRLGSIVSTSLDAVIVVNRYDRVVEFNPAAERIFGYSRDEALGERISDLIVPETLTSAHMQGLRRYTSTGKRTVIDAGLIQLEAKRKDGGIFPVELSNSTADSAEGELFISFIRDISDRVIAEQELVEARDKAVLGEKAKADLLAVMSHEMRTPLNGILGTLELLEATKLNDKQSHYVDVMGTSGRMLLRHVNDVLDVSRMEVEEAEPERKPFDIAELAKSVARTLQSQVDANGNDLTVRILGPVPKAVIGDPDRIEQVLVNLVGNAAKFTSEGRITVEVEATLGSDDIDIRVIDTGIGIAEGEIGRIFDDFVTLDASYSRKAAGTGLGLGIVKRLIGILGGEVGVESEVGGGSVFWVRLPLPATRVREVTTSDEAIDAVSVPYRKTILLVEDNEVNRMVAREMLLANGCEVQEAADGEEGIARAAEQQFDAILMDINMPKLDGMSAARRIRDSKGPNRSTPMVALTAYALPEDTRRFRDTGFNDVLIKPLSRQRLGAVLSRQFGHDDVGAVDAFDELVEILGEDSANKVRTRAVAEILGVLDELEAALPTGELPEHAGDSIHRLTGLSALVGLSATHETLSMLEIAATKNDTPGVKAALSKARSTLEFSQAAE